MLTLAAALPPFLPGPSEVGYTVSESVVWRDDPTNGIYRVMKMWQKVDGAEPVWWVEVERKINSNMTESADNEASMFRRATQEDFATQRHEQIDPPVHKTTAMRWRPFVAGGLILAGAGLVFFFTVKR